MSFDTNTFKSLATTSAKIRYAASFGNTRSQIVKLFKEHLQKEIRYQHVRNVLLQEPKKKETSEVREVTRMVEGDL